MDKMDVRIIRDGKKRMTNGDQVHTSKLFIEILSSEGSVYKYNFLPILCWLGFFLTFCLPVNIR